MDEHVQEVQNLYKEKEDKKGERMEDKKVILIKPYKVDCYRTKVWTDFG